MGQIDWAVLGQFGGQAIEDFIAACLCQRYDDAQQVKAGRGDSGIDIWRRGKAGITNWQVKKFTSPLSGNQWGQVEKSWKTFNEKWVASGEGIEAWYLVTPWTPTLKYLAKFQTLTGESGFKAMWKSEAFIDGLASDFPGTYARYFKGENFLEDMIMQKAVLAGLPLTEANSVSMLQAISSKEDDLDSIRQLVSDNYSVDHGYITGTGNFPPIPQTGAPALMHRFTFVGHNRYKYETVVAKTADAAEVEPISFSIRFNADAGSDEEKALREWSEWGVPFESISASVQTNGGPFAENEPHDSVLSFVQPPSERVYPDLILAPVVNGSHGTELRLKVVEATRGFQTDWLRLVTDSPQHVVKIELRMTSQDGLKLNFTLTDLRDKEVSEVIEELDWVESFIAANDFILNVEGVGVLANGTAGSPPDHAEIFFQIARALAIIQQATSVPLRMPDLRRLTEHEYRELLGWADVYAGNAQSGVWATREFERPSDDSDDAAAMRFLLERKAGAFVFYPMLELAGQQIQLEKPVAQNLKSYKIGGTRSFDEIPPGEKFELVPGEDDEIITSLPTKAQLAMIGHEAIEGD